MSLSVKSGMVRGEFMTRIYRTSKSGTLLRSGGQVKSDAIWPDEFDRFSDRTSGQIGYQETE